MSERQIRRTDDSVRSLITDLLAAATAVSLYGEGHPRARQRMEALHLVLTELLDRLDDTLLLAVAGSELFVDGKPFTRLARQAPRLVQRLRHTGIEYVSFKPGVTAEELLSLVQALAAGCSPPWRAQPHLAVGRLAYTLPGSGGIPAEPSREPAAELPAVRERVSLLGDAFDCLASGSALPVDHFELVARAIGVGLGDAPNPLLQLAPWQGPADWLAVHSHNVGVLAAGLSGLAGLSAASCHDMALAGLFHDVGKAFREPDLAERELRLAGDELELIIDHPKMGLEVLLACEGVPEVAAIVAYEHHLAFNAAGYPPLRHSRRPHPASRLVAVADAFDWLYTARTALGAIRPDGIVSWIAERQGTLFDPGWARAVCTLLVVSR